MVQCAAEEIAANHRFATGARLDQVRPEPAAGRAGLIALLEQGQASGELRQFDTRAMAVAMRHAIDGALAELERDPEFEFVTAGVGAHLNYWEDNPEDLRKRIQAVWSAPDFRRNSGTGVSPRRRVPRLVVEARRFFTPS